MYFLITKHTKKCSLLVQSHDSTWTCLCGTFPNPEVVFSNDPSNKRILATEETAVLAISRESLKVIQTRLPVMKFAIFEQVMLQMNRQLAFSLMRTESARILLNDTGRPESQSVDQSLIDPAGLFDTEKANFSALLISKLPRRGTSLLINDDADLETIVENTTLFSTPAKEQALRLSEWQRHDIEACFIRFCVDSEGTKAVPKEKMTAMFKDLGIDLPQNVVRKVCSFIFIAPLTLNTFLSIFNTGLNTR